MANNFVAIQAERIGQREKGVGGERQRWEEQKRERKSKAVCMPLATPAAHKESHKGTQGISLPG